MVVIDNGWYELLNERDGPPTPLFNEKLCVGLWQKKYTKVDVRYGIKPPIRHLTPLDWLKTSSPAKLVIIDV